MRGATESRQLREGSGMAAQHVDHVLRTQLQSEVWARDEAIARLQAELQAQLQASALQVGWMDGWVCTSVPTAVYQHAQQQHRPPHNTAITTVTATPLPQLSQVQDTFLAKLTDMRQLHTQQLAAAEAAAQVRPQPCAAGWTSTRPHARLPGMDIKPAGGPKE
jgi:hypothetical protein